MPMPAPILVAEDDDADVIFLQHVCKILKIPNPVVALHDGDEVVNYLQGKARFEIARSIRSRLCCCWI